MEVFSTKKIKWPQVKKVLRRGGVIVFPTDTAYGLGADYSSKKAVQKIYKIKNRPPEKKIALVASDLEQVKKYFSLNKKELALAKKYWPGPLTLVLKLKRKKSKVGVRVPGSKVAREICRCFGKPITATSANISGKNTPYSVASVTGQLKKEKPDLIIDGGLLKKVKPSTIIEIQKSESRKKIFKIKIIRKGPIII